MTQFKSVFFFIMFNVTGGVTFFQANQNICHLPIRVLGALFSKSRTGPFRASPTLSSVTYQENLKTSSIGKQLN